MHRSRLVVVLMAVASMTACVGPLPAPAPAQPAVAAAGPTAGAAPVASTLSYGTVTSQVVRGKTSQFELLQIFGGPNISTIDGTGLETWVYERSSTQTDVAANAQSAQGTASLGAFFKYIDVGVSGSTGSSAARSSTSSSVRSLTVIVKCAPDKTVADYTVRASTF
ncbi:hypothetical protein BH10PSE17_BH10PSE17_10690 [soil metagenome]